MPFKEPKIDGAENPTVEIGVLRRFRNFAELTYGAETIKTNEVVVIDKRKSQTQKKKSNAVIP